MFTPQSKLCELILCLLMGIKNKHRTLVKTQENGMIEERIGPVDNLFSHSTRDI